MPSFSQSAGPAAANPDGISLQSASGVLAQKSETLTGAVVTSDFTTTSGSLVDVTGMTITLASTSNVATKLSVRLAKSITGGATSAFHLATTAGTLAYIWTVFPAPNAGGSNVSMFNSGDASDTPALTTIDAVLLDGYITGTTSGAVVKVQGSATAVATLTVKVGSAIIGVF